MGILVDGKWRDEELPAETGQRGEFLRSDSRFREYRIPNGATVDTLDGRRVAGIPKHVLRAAGALFLGPAFVELEQQVTSSLFADDRNTIPVAGWRAGVTTVRLSGDLAR